MFVTTEFVITEFDCIKIFCHYFFHFFSKDFQKYRNFREGDRGERHQVSTLHLFYGERSKKLDRFIIKQ